MGIFDKVHNRKNTHSVKWDALDRVFNTEDVLPMWVADMDFRAPEAVNQAIKERAEHGIYGYTTMDKDLDDAVIHWLKDRHQWNVDDSWITYSPGVVTSLLIAIQAFTKPGDAVLIQTPVYPPFFKSITAHERKIVTNPLIETDHYYTIDFEAFEQALQKDVKAFILCSPHNPVGRVWKKEELKRIADLCIKYNVLIISDEIHCDLVYEGHTHTPIASLSTEISQQTITCMSPTKTFNLAGLQTSYVICEDEEKRNTFIEHIDKQGISQLNTIGNIALEAAYMHGHEWLDELKEILESHKDYVVKRLESETSLKVTKTEGTYLLWIDCSSLGLSSEELHTFMIQKARVGLNAGFSYGEEGATYARINIACPKETLVEGINRIIDAVNLRT